MRHAPYAKAKLFLMDLIPYPLLHAGMIECDVAAVGAVPAGCEACFAARYLGNLQIVMVKSEIGY
jgi:NADPH-dependent 2,4-dienoyl-CoA reductase/sulfur reductase-like enzyme